MGIVSRIASLFTGFNWVIIPASFLAVVLHEICHGYAALLLGDKTAKNMGRLSLNPFKHFDLAGILCMVLFKVGWAKPVPINPLYFRKQKLGICIVSACGPLANIVAAFMSIAVSVLISLIDTGNAVVLFVLNTFFEFFRIFAVLNVSLAVFNFLPIPPLDGSKILFALLPNKAYGFILNYERYGILLLLILINIPFFSDVLGYVHVQIFNEMAYLVSKIILNIRMF